MLLLTNRLAPRCNSILKTIARELNRRGIRVLLRKPFLSIAKKVFGLTIVTVDELVSDRSKYFVQKFGCIESVTISEPHSLSEIPNVFRKYLQNFTTDRPFACEVINAELVGATAAGFDENGGIILETTIPQLSDNHLAKSLNIQALVPRNILKPSSTKLDVACSLVNKYSRNYWHWIVDCLTRIEGLEYYQEHSGIKASLVIDSNPTPWQKDSLKLLGYDPDRCFHWNRSRVQVDRLVVPSFRRFIVNNNLHSFVSPKACYWVGQRILSNLHSGNNKPTFSSKIFISRNKTLARRVVNEDDVMEALTPLGFIAYTLEEMSFAEQVKLFSQARMVVSPHGAGLTNIIFSQNLTVIELFSSFIQPCFYLLSKGLGHEYGFLKCQVPPTEFRWEDGDMVANVSEVLSLVNRIHGH